MQLESIMYGQCALNEEIQGDGKCWAVFRLNSKDQSILLELHIHPDGKIEESVNSGLSVELDFLDILDYTQTQFRAKGTASFN